MSPFRQIVSPPLRCLRAGGDVVEGLHAGEQSDPVRLGLTRDDAGSGDDAGAEDEDDQGREFAEDGEDDGEDGEFDQVLPRAEGQVVVAPCYGGQAVLGCRPGLRVGLVLEDWTGMADQEVEAR